MNKGAALKINGYRYAFSFFFDCTAISIYLSTSSPNKQYTCVVEIALKTIPKVVLVTGAREQTAIICTVSHLMADVFVAALI